MLAAQHLKTHIITTLAGFMGGAIYALFSDGLGEPIALFNGMCIGLIGGFLVSVFELYVFKPKEQQFSFTATVVLKTAFYFVLSGVVTVLVKGLNESLYFGEGFLDYVQGARFQHFLLEEDFHIIMIYSLLLVGIIIFTKEMSRKMGQGVLLNFITGYYHQPRQEERIFMFLDLRNSTSLAEKMGVSPYYALLNSFFFDVAEQVVPTGGIVYRYVGDQVVFSWKTDTSQFNTNSIKAYFLAKQGLEQQRQKYLDKWGVFPEFRASLHCGTVIVGEIGDVKSQIVFLGEPMYVTAKIEKRCSELGADVLISADLLARVVLPAYYKPESAGVLELDFLDKPLELFSLHLQKQDLTDWRPVRRRPKTTAGKALALAFHLPFRRQGRQAAAV